MQTYSYTKSPVALDRLELEVRESEIITALDLLTLDGVDSLSITFKAVLSEGDKIILDNIVDAHSGEPLPPTPNQVEIATPAEVIPTTIKNEHTMQPCGCCAHYFESKNASEGDYICAITLSNKSQDGLTFTYSSTIEPTIGNYVFQSNLTKRSWITSIDTQTQTVTFELPELEEGAAIYTKGAYLDFKIPNWKDTMYLWGVTLTIKEYDSQGNLETNPCEDFIELSILDKDDMFKTDEVCQALFGVNAADADPYLLAMGFEINGEFGDHWAKYYDESWVMNINNNYTHTPDGAPGQLLAGLYLHLTLFTTENELHKYKIFADYYLTSKD